MSKYFYPATSLTGGAVGALDYIDGTGLADGDGAIVIVGGDSIYFYVLDADSAAAESSPSVIAPDANAGDKRWVQVGVSGAVAFASAAEIITGTEDAKAITPAALEDSGIVPQGFATGAEIATGTVSTKVIAPDGLAHADAATGTGKVVRATSPTLTTPILGTPTSGSLVNCTGVVQNALATATSDVLVGNTGGGSWIKKTLAEFKTILGLGTAAYTAATDYMATGATAAGADHSWDGRTAEMVAGEAIAFGEVCYIKSDGKLWKAKADALATALEVFICLEAASSDETKTFGYGDGFIRDDHWAWTVGGPIYLSAATGGALTQTAPTATDSVTIIVGVATHADRMFKHTFYYHTHT